MDATRTIDLEALLAPVTEDKPVGDFVRDSGIYDAIKEARRADDNLNKGEWQRETKVADWGKASKIALEALTSKTKDLQIAAWLTEALVNQYGFAGLRDGLDLLTALAEYYWEVLFPLLEDGDPDARAGIIEWLNDKLPAAINQIAITVPTDKAEAYSFLRYQESRAVEELGRKSQELKEAAIAEGKITAEQFDNSVAAGSRKFYEDLFADLHADLERSQKLARVVDEKFGKDAPSLMGLKQVLEDGAHVIESIVKKKREAEPDPPLPGVQVNSTGANAEVTETERNDAQAVLNGGFQRSSTVPTSVTTATGLTNRAEALRQLQAIAEFFQQTEPHSPVSYLVQRAVKWGQMPLEKWLTDVISDEGVLTRIRETLGIKDSGNSGG
jgi:type VI secretion system protein ImpA